MVMVTTILPKQVREFMLTKTTRVPTQATQILMMMESAMVQMPLQAFVLQVLISPTVRI